MVTRLGLPLPARPQPSHASCSARSGCTDGSVPAAWRSATGSKPGPATATAGGMNAPVLAVGDGALGFWAALREVFPDTREQGEQGEQQCWFHVQANVLNVLPKSAPPGAKAALAESSGAQDRRHALDAVKIFAADYGAKWPKAAAKITEHVDVPLDFYNCPAEHWVHCARRIPSRRPSPRSGCGNA